jgi:hypothetical protein
VALLSELASPGVDRSFSRNVLTGRGGTTRAVCSPRPRREWRGGSGDLRLQRPARPPRVLPATTRSLRGFPGRDVRGIDGGRRSYAPGSTNKTWQFAGFFTGATGLEPATSGVTGRSCRFRAERRSAGIPARSRAFSTVALRGIGGCRRELPACSRGICAGWIVVLSVNDWEERGMQSLSCGISNRDLNRLGIS